MSLQVLQPLIFLNDRPILALFVFVSSFPLWAVLSFFSRPLFFHLISKQARVTWQYFVLRQKGFFQMKWTFTLHATSSMKFRRMNDFDPHRPTINWKVGAKYQHNQSWMLAQSVALTRCDNLLALKVCSWGRSQCWSGQLFFESAWSNNRCFG